MQVEIDVEVASKLAASVLMQDYKQLLEYPYYGDTDESWLYLTDAYRAVIAYSTVESQRKEAGVVLEGDKHA